LIELVTDQNEECLDNLLNVGIQATTTDFEFLDAIDFEKGFSFCRDDEVLSFSKPTLIVVGRQDSIVGYQDAWQLMEGFPRATFAVLDYSGHALGVGERNTIFRALVNDWIDRLEKDAQH
jgi:pimeloyl-ACP methyl ester carboxylesterase